MMKIYEIVQVQPWGSDTPTDSLGAYWRRTDGETPWSKKYDLEDRAVATKTLRV